MTFDPATTLPPRWAESLLRMLLEPEHRDSVSGDLLEAYRDAIAPVRGAGASRWYLVQVAGFVWRAVWPWSLLIAAALTIRGVVDMLSPTTYIPGEIHIRSWLMTNALLATWLAAGCFSAWRFGRIRSGVLVSFAAALVGGALSTVGGAIALAIWHDPETLRNIAGSGGLDEMWGVPLILVPVATIWGTAGAVIGRLLRGCRRSAPPAPPLADGRPKHAHTARVIAICGPLLASAVMARESIDWWLAPTQDFYVRSVISTAVAVAIFAVAGLWTGWRSRSVRRSALAGFGTGLLSAVVVTIGTAIHLALRHDPHTMRMIRASGGLDEAFLLPYMVAVAGTVLSVIGGVIGKTAGWSAQRFSAVSRR